VKIDKLSRDYCRFYWTKYLKWTSIWSSDKKYARDNRVILI